MLSVSQCWGSNPGPCSCLASSSIELHPQPWYVRVYPGGWEDALAVQNTCSCSRQRLRFRYSDDGSQLPVISVPGNPATSSTLHRHQVRPWCAHIFAGKIHIKSINLRFLRTLAYFSDTVLFVCLFLFLPAWILEVADLVFLVCMGSSLLSSPFLHECSAFTYSHSLCVVTAWSRIMGLYRSSKNCLTTVYQRLFVVLSKGLKEGPGAFQFLSQANFKLPLKHYRKAYSTILERHDSGVLESKGLDWGGSASECSATSNCDPCMLRCSRSGLMCSLCEKHLRGQQLTHWGRCRLTALDCARHLEMSFLPAPRHPLLPAWFNSFSVPIFPSPFVFLCLKWNLLACFSLTSTKYK